MRTRAIGLLMFLTALSCGPECLIEPRQSVSSPDQKYVATVFESNCHATSPYVTSVSIRCHDCAFDPDDSVLSLHGKPGVELSWQGDNRLMIRFTPARVYTAKDSWHHVTIVREMREHAPS